MGKIDPCFTHFKTDVSGIDLPEKFTFPFYYTPNQLSLVAASELQDFMSNQTEWTLPTDESEPFDSYSIGKMFGVLVVKNIDGQLGYLSAFSGKLVDKNHRPGFVPPVFDMLEEGNFFLAGMVELNVIQDEIRAFENQPEYLTAIENQKAIFQSSVDDIKSIKASQQKAKAERKKKRAKSIEELSDEDYQRMIAQLAQESQSGRIYLKNTIKKWKEKIDESNAHLDTFLVGLKALKEKRKAKSSGLQKQLFESYQFLNIKGEIKTLNSIFLTKPPKAGAGECAAPKLMQYAFEHNYLPISMAEFWWGRSPKSAVRKHKQFYPACRGKCEPILGHMLDGMDIDDNPLLVNPGLDKEISIVYEDEHIVIINKPEDLLSVPGITIKDSVATRIEAMYPDDEGPFIVHRLDMSTSGIMILTKHKEAHQKVQAQFINRTIKKRYVALLEGYAKRESGLVELPLRVDLDDRPRQLFCNEHGKSAVTKWEVIKRRRNTTKVYFYPITGRTHQLRVHAAHPQGMNQPIVGDDLYGTKERRLFLHAESIEFQHPITKEEMKIQVEEDF